jgi:hypothetical protein
MMTKYLRMMTLLIYTPMQTVESIRWAIHSKVNNRQSQDLATLPISPAANESPKVVMQFNLIVAVKFWL